MSSRSSSRFKSVVTTVIGVMATLISLQSAISIESDVVRINDRAGDDFGAGGITYPQDPVFYPGCFDLTGLSIEITDKQITFNVAFRTDIKSPPDLMISELYSLKEICKHHFYAPNIDIYLHTEDPELPGVNWLLPGRKASLSAGYRWDRMLLISPTPNLAKSKLLSSLQKGFLFAQSEKGSAISKSKAKHDAKAVMNNQIFIATQFQINKNTISISVPRSWFPSSNIHSWKLQVIVTGAEFTDSVHITQFIRRTETLGNLLVREISVLPSQWAFGGATGITGESNIIDILETPEWNQTDILSRFSETQTCRIPLVSIAQDEN